MSCIGRFHTRARTNRLKGQIVWHCPSDVNLCRTVVDLFVSTDKSSWKNRLSRRPNIRRFVRRKNCSSRFPIGRTMTICSSENDLPVQTICSSSRMKTAIVLISAISLFRHFVFFNTCYDVVSWSCYGKHTV